MQLIKRTTLHYQEGTSDKVYEVDLCLVGSDRYVVNFRYGRRGATLKEGVKTEQPVTLAQAEKAFDKLVGEKTKKGYQDVSSTLVTETPAPKTLNPPNPDAQKQAILTRLAAPSDKKWPLERVIWRAGELKITEAVPELLKLIGTGEPLRDYCIAWALGNCGDKTALPTLKNLYQNSQNPEFVRRISWEAAFKLSEAIEKENLRSQKIAELPKLLQETAKNGSATEFANLLKAYLQTCDYQGFAVLDTIYQINNENVRPALLEILRTAPFKPNYFKQIRHIFKIAEYRLDAEIFGIIAYRIEKEKANFRSNIHLIHLPENVQLARYGYKYNPESRRWEKVDNDEVLAELKSPNSRIAYSNFTREYLRRRIWHTLQELGESGDDNYVKMAANILLQYSDRDAQPPKQTNFLRWQRFNNNWQSITTSISWDIYAGYLTFNHILYENSPRYEYRENNKAWVCKENYKPGDLEPNVREEAFPKLWEQKPTELLNLLLESNCQPVHQFAIKALRDCSQFCTELDVETIVKLLNKPYEVTARFAFELAQTLYNSAAPNLELVLALASCVILEARTTAFRWIEETREPFLADANLIASLVINPFADTRQFARQLLNSSILNENAAKLLIVKIITEVLALPNDAGEKAKDIAETLLTCFTPQLRTLGMSIIQDLLRHSVLEVQELGARILVNHETSAENLPPGLIDSLIVSEYESIRGLGIRIFGQLPDSTLLNQYSLLMAMATHELADIRNAIRPVIRRLATDHSDFAARLATEAIDLLMLSKTKEEVCQYLVRFLKEDLPEWMTNISKDTALRLLKAKSSATQELAGYVIIANADKWAAEFETMEIVKLADNEILAVREAARQIFLKNLPRFRGNEAEMLSGVRIVESKWEDTQEFGFRLFNTFFTAEDLTPSVLITLCDSIKEEVRSFGRNLVTRYFQEADKQEYLLKFSEHPAADMQLFVTNYLESYAVNAPEKLEELTPYFITVLSLVNRGSVAKKRIFAFLNGEAQKSLEAATVVAEIMTRQSATMVIADKAAAIECMVNIKRTYPDLELPILVKEFKTADERR
ncbi:WGR domain-containing protein [Phormidium sp. LEGE 05292]|uniref:WGR domain-containing protein n=1 Tax=[Phormidium] sp. LEGE 05292 TaxID=767427 RepID=UPI0018825B9A|nr:WGR domain-containing protein [Phormidium sp. LEGE 05292]MBE9227412.1 WGR domain-containing protein [Phormidium sp. LEGE 05292]